MYVTGTWDIVHIILFIYECLQDMVTKANSLRAEKSWLMRSILPGVIAV